MTDLLDRARAFFAEDDRPERRRHGKYELVREAGRGGMATVWEAWDPELKRRVALKVMSGGSLERLRREAEAAARLRHPGVVAVHDVGVDFIAMDFVEGRTFDVAHARRLELLEQAVEAVAHAHAQGVVHRDLKPQNLLVTPEGRVVLTDFGLARIEGAEALTRTGAVVGTPHSMAPEQVRGEVSRIGPATDVWALGVMLYEAVSGRKPFDGPTPLAIHDAIVRSEPARLEGAVGSIVAKCLEKNPARRYRDASALLNDLRNFKGGSRVDARSSDAGRWIRRNTLPILLFATSVAILAVGLWLGRWVTDGRRKSIEALRDQARISLDAALELRRAGANDRMRQFLPPMESAYAAAVQLDPENPEVHWLMGRMYRALMEDEKALERQRLAARAEGFAPVEYELALLLAGREANRMKSTLDASLGEGGVSGGEPDRRDAIVQHSAGFVARAQLGHERSVAEALTQFCGQGDASKAKGILEAVLRIDPSHEDARMVLAWVIRSEMLPGVEGRESSWREAEKLYTEGLARDRGFVPHWLARGQLRWSRGSARRHRGLDPGPDYVAAEKDFDEAIRLNPEHPEPWTWRGQARVYRGIWAMEQGKDPLQILASADEDMAKALSLDPRNYRAALWRGNAGFYRGVRLASQGLDPMPTFQHAKRWLDHAAAIGGPGKVELRWRGRLLAQMGAAMVRKGEDPESAFKGALLDFEDEKAATMPTGARLATPDPWNLMWRSTVHTERARHRFARGEEALEDLRAGRQLLDEALGRSPNFGEALRHRAMLHYQEGETRAAKGDRPGAAEAFGRAAADFDAALAVNPNFRHQVGDLDAKARKKADELK